MSEALKIEEDPWKLQEDLRKAHLLKKDGQDGRLLKMFYNPS